MEGFVESSGLNIYYRRLGAPASSTRPLVVLHGGPGGSHDILLPGVTPLAERREVILYDQRGCGRSDPLGAKDSCTLADNVADLELLRDELGLRRIDLMGHSWGALLAMAYALQMQENVRRLILVAPAVPYYPNPSWSEFLATVSEETLSEIARVREGTARSEIAKRAAVWRMTIREFINRKEVLREVDLDEMPYSPRTAAQIAADLNGLDLRPGLARLKLPTCILAGRCDRRLPLKYHESLAALLPDAQLKTFENSGHFPFLEEKERFVDVLEEFLA